MHECGYCGLPATQELRDEYYEDGHPLAWMKSCDHCPKLEIFEGSTLRPLAAIDHFHVVGTKGFHPNNAWHHHKGNLYTLGGSAYAFLPDQLHACHGPVQPYGRCASF